MYIIPLFTVMRQNSLICKVTIQICVTIQNRLLFKLLIEFLQYIHLFNMVEHPCNYNIVMLLFKHFPSLSSANIILLCYTSRRFQALANILLIRLLI
jgi:hypothetical protein